MASILLVHREILHLPGEIRPGDSFTFLNQQ